MILATIPHQGQRLPVEVVDAVQGKATVRTLDGAEIFPRWTHGGWCMDAEANVPADLLADIIVSVQEGVPAQILETAT